MEHNLLWPLSLPQLDIYYDQLLFADAPIYNIGGKIPIENQVNVSIMKEAYGHLFKHADILRCVVSEDGGTPRLKFLPDIHYELEYKDFSKEEGALKAAEDFMSAQFKRPFDLKGGKLLHRTVLIKVTPGFYYIFSVYHHLIVDGWSTSLMFRYLAKFYNDLIENGGTSTAEHYSYVPFIESSLQYIHSEQYKQDASYWKDRFLVLPESLIPLKKVRVLDPMEPASSRTEMWISRTEYALIQELSARVGGSTFQVLLAVFYTYFGRFYDNNDFSIGVPVLNRNSYAFKNTVGLFMSMMPLRIKIDFEGTFQELVHHIKDNLRRDYRHQRFPLSHIIRDLQAHQERDRVFNITFSYEKHDYAYSIGDSPVRVLPLSNDAERSALAIYVREFDERQDVKIDFDYNHNYFDARQMERLIGHLRVMLQQVLENPIIRLSRIQLIDAAEMVSVIGEFNNTKFAYADNETFVEMFSRAAAQWPKAVAIEDVARQYIYEQADRISTDIANYLVARLGVKKGQVVGVIMSRSAHTVIAMIAILKAGGAFLPLDPAFPVERLHYILKQSKVEVCLVDEGNGQVIQPIAGVRTVDFVHAVTSNSAAEQPFHSNSPLPHDSAYVIYTSGSTGAPKGVEITHFSLSNFLVSMSNVPGIKKEDRILAITTYSFDICLLEFFLPLISGASVYVASQHSLREPEELIELIREWRPTLMQGTPSFWKMLLDSGWQGDKNMRVLCGGEPLGYETGRKLIEAAAELWNMYGPTETTIWSTLKKIHSALDIGSIGRPINNTEIYILDQNLQPMPIEGIGEIYIAGNGLAKGYHHRKDLTEERFLINPFDPERKMYRTGDVGRWLSSGDIEFLGRKDNQVKIRGHRIEIEEIERVIATYPKIKEAVVVVTKKSGGSLLVACMVVKESTDLNELVGFLKAKLPEYMIPGAFVELGEIPLTANGKVDRKSLSEMAIPAMPAAGVQPAEGPAEEKLKKIWEGVLGHTNIGVNDNFFSLGGHSLKAVELINEIQKHFDCRPKLKTIFNFPTIRQLAKEIINSKGNKSRPIPVVSLSNNYPLSPAQNGLWFISQSKTGSIAYNMSAAFYIANDVELTALQKAFRSLVGRHESLRTIFPVIDAEPRQKILTLDQADCSMEHYYTVNDTADEYQTGLVKKLKQVELDLEKGPLVRLSIISPSVGKRILVFVIHHIIADGWSIDILINEMISLYRDYSKGKEAVLPPLSIQYKDYVSWLSEQTTAKTMEKFKNYWMSRLEGCSFSCPLPVDKIPPTEQTYKGDALSFQIESNVAAQIKALADSHNCSLFMVLVSLLKATMFSVTGQRDICIGTPVSGRQHEQLQDQVGLYVNSVCLRTSINAQNTFGELLENVKETCLEAFEFQLYPYEQLVRDINAKGAAPRHSIFQALMILQKKGVDLNRVEGLGREGWVPLETGHDMSRLPISFNFVEQEQLLCTIEFSTEMFERESVQLFYEKFVKMVSAVLANPLLPLSQYDIRLDIEKNLLSRNVSIDIHI
ncbi:MAG: amino acid adenylation domain-containing protein [Ginsengibacter sp.]